MNIDLIDDLMGFNRPKRQPAQQRRQAEPEKKVEPQKKTYENSRVAPKV
jgi:hypothetical protein